MSVNVAAELALMKQMRVPDLKRRYAEVFGEETKSNNREHLIKRIVWRVQAMSEGGLSQRARSRAAEITDEAQLRLRAPRESAIPPMLRGAFPVAQSPCKGPKPGTVLTRYYQGRDVVVVAREQGFEYEGEVYRSLTAVTRKVTGSHWNGRHFFGLAPWKVSQPRAKEEIGVSQ